MSSNDLSEIGSDVEVNRTTNINFIFFVFVCRITVKFLVNVLKTDHVNKIESIVAIRQWLKCSMLLTNPNEVCITV